MSLIVLKKIIEMFIILLVGVIIYKAKIINDVSTKHLSNVLLLLVSPLLIIQSYQIDFNRDVLYEAFVCYTAFHTFRNQFLGAGLEVTVFASVLHGCDGSHSTVYFVFSSLEQFEISRALIAS